MKPEIETGKEAAASDDNQRPKGDGYLERLVGLLTATPEKCLQCGTQTALHKPWCSFSGEEIGCPVCDGEGYLPPQEDGDEAPCEICETKGRIKCVLHCDDDIK